jgi:galactitol PTS system EIIA component
VYARPMTEPGLCFVGLEVASAEAAVRALAQRLCRAGKVKASFEAAAVSREKRSPTGLPFAGGAIALPHAEPEHVESPAIAIATLARPVTFREMGNPASALAVDLIVMPALTAKDQAARGLARLLHLLERQDFRDELRALGDPVALCDAFTRRWEDQ